jgi:ribosome-associated protein
VLQWDYLFNIASKGDNLLEALEFARFIVEVVEDKKAEDILLLDLRPKAIIADFFVICTGNSDRQVKALAENIREKVKETYQRLPHTTQGANDSGWVLMDYSDVIVHIFTEDKRAYYNLEGLWRAESQVLLSIQ